MNGVNDMSDLLCKLYPLKLNSLFSNVEKVDDNKFQVFRVVNEHGSDAGMITYLGENEWRIYVDNFPLQKKYFTTNLPMNTVQDFINYMQRTGLVLLTA